MMVELDSAGTGVGDSRPNIVDTSGNFEDTPGSSSSGLKPAERSVSFNRDVHVKRIGRGAPRVTSALAGDGEGRLMPTPVHKESIGTRSKEDLAHEAALVLQQAESLNCVARDNRRQPSKFNTLPARRGTKKRIDSSPNDNRASEITGESPTTKRKKKLDRSVSDASAQKHKSPLAKLFTPKLERKHNGTVKRSVSDAGTSDREKIRRKRSGSDNETGDTSSPTPSTRIKKQLSPIIEASPQVDKPFDFTGQLKPREHIVHIQTEVERDEVDEARDMPHSSRYDSRDTGSTIRKMIHRLSNDRSPPPRLTSTMVAPGPGFGHNNNRPFSYTRPNDDVTQPSGSITISDKKRPQRSHSDSDEGLGLDRKDSSRENSPAEKDYRGVPYNPFYETRRNGEINGFDSRYDKPDRYTSKIFVQEDTNRNLGGITSKTSELSARRDLLESRMKSRLLNEDPFSGKGNGIFRKTEHEIIDKPIVPSPVTPDRVSSPKRYSETYISETRTNSNGEKYIFEKELREDNGKVFGFEKKITNKIPPNYAEPSPVRGNGYKVETRTDKHGDKYIIETKLHDDYNEGEFKPFMSDKSRTSPEERFETLGNKVSYVKAPVTVNRFIENREFSKSEDFLDREPRNVSRRRDLYVPKMRKNLETIRGISKSSQRLDEVVEKSLPRSGYMTRSHENLRLDSDYVNTRDFRRANGRQAYRNDIRDGRLNDDYDTDISQMTNSHLETNGYYDKENRRTSQIRKRYNGSYDGSPPSRVRNDSERGYNSSRYDSDATGGRESVHRREVRYRTEETSRSVRKEHRKIPEERSVPLRGSRNRLDYLDDSESARESPRGGKTRLHQSRLETFDESPEMTPRVFHESKVRRERHESRHRETGLTDPDRKDRLADSGIENDYRRDSQEADRREPLESEDEGFVTLQFIKHERKHTDRNMNLTPLEKRRYDKYTSKVTSKPPSGLNDKKFEKKVTKKSGTMSKVRQLFGKKEKKDKEEKNKMKRRPGDADGSSSGGTGALTDDEVTQRYKEYRGDRLRSAKSARDLDYDIEQEYRERRRLSTPSESPSPGRPTRLSRSTGTLTHEESYLESTTTLTRENQTPPETKGWFKSLSRKNKTSTKNVDKKSRIPESEIMTTGTEDEEVSSAAPERISANKNIRFCGDTDQESLSSHRDLHSRNKRDDQHVPSRREKTIINAVRQGIVNGARKPVRHAESALSSGESTTGDSSQQSQNSQRSQRSVVYLHAATVGEIPGPNERRRAASREELNRPLQSHTRTVSRSVSVLAPWKPRHYREPFEINYDQQYHKPTTTLRRRQRSRDEATLGRKGKDPSRRSKDNLSKTGTMSRSTLKSKDKQKVDRTVSTESLQHSRAPKNGTSRVELNRSTSVPRDPNKSAGWFKIKSKKSRA
ncbi:uncharacterized protein blo isoform X1 [Fopius arisanus]|uniref:Uncharacterized protein blo isoform X1 n=2 Tax=Fopius arisanus TaxID=64838 RepID=A0A0C9QR86_9HYME|nr:PREDICTED: uncharacterized protein LOC105271164 isoform X1 [Fopius arisanus]